MPFVQYSVDIGDRVTIRSPRAALAALVGRLGTVVEVFRVPLDSCMVRLDGDPNQQREWLFYRDEFAISGA